MKKIYCCLIFIQIGCGQKNQEPFDPKKDSNATITVEKKSNQFNDDICNSYISIQFYNKDSLNRLLKEYDNKTEIEKNIFLKKISKELNSVLNSSYSSIENDSFLMSTFAFYKHLNIEKYKNQYFPLEKRSIKELIENNSFVMDDEYPPLILDKYIKYKCFSFHNESWFVSYDYHFSDSSIKLIQRELPNDIQDDYLTDFLYRKYLYDYNHILSNQELIIIINKLMTDKNLSKHDLFLLNKLKEAQKNTNIVTFFSME